MFGIALIPSQRAILEELFIQMSLIGNFDMQKAPGLAETCESNHRCGFSCFSKVCSTWIRCLIPVANTWIEHKIVSSNTYTLAHFRVIWSRNTQMFWVSLLVGTRGENKINGSNFTLANETPIKLKKEEKLKSGRCERLTVTWLMRDGRAAPKAHRWFFSQPRFPIQTGDFTGGWLLIQECSFPK